MKTALLNIGNELLSGVTVNTNAAWMGQRLQEIGFPVNQTLVVPDHSDAILQALSVLWDSMDLVIVTGGLGPTHDDITVGVLAEFFHSPLELHEPTFQRLKARLTGRAIPVTKDHEQQAMMPGDAHILQNGVGTAPGIHFQQEGKHLFSLPGVPAEMRDLMENKVLPILKEWGGLHLTSRVIRTIGVPESSLFNSVRSLVLELPNGSVGFLPQYFGVDIRINGGADEISDERVDEIREKIRNEFPGALYTESNDSMASVVGDLLRENEMTVATSESCTGGLLADMFTDISGSSDYFIQGFITYSNDAKIAILGVPGEMLQEHGAVSEEVARAMAMGAQEMAGTSVALSTTGIAGPTGGTPDKPVGLVYIGCAVGGNVSVRKFHFPGDRRSVKERAAVAALNMLRLELLTS